MKNKILSFITSCVLVIPILAQAVPTQNLWEVAALGTQPAVTQVSLMGYNGAIPATLETMWPESAVYTPLTTAMSSPYCASSSANDTSAGTGARTINVSGIDTSFAAFSETVTLNGQSSVNLATANILLINSMEVLTAGSGGLNAGIIQCGTGANTLGDPAVTHSYMPVSSQTAVAGAGNKTLSFIYGVPAGYTLLCRNISAGSTFTTAASSLQIVVDGYTNLGLQKRFFEQAVHNTGSNPSMSTTIVKFPEKTIITGMLAGPTGANTGPATLTADCLKINNAYLDQPGGIL